MLELAKTILVKQAESIKIVEAEDNKDAEVRIHIYIFIIVIGDEK